MRNTESNPESRFLELADLALDKGSERQRRKVDKKANGIAKDELIKSLMS